MFIPVYRDIRTHLGSCRMVIRPPWFATKPSLTGFRIYPPEIIPLYIRSKTVSLATFFNWLMNFSLTFFTPPAFQHIQWKVRLSFSIRLWIWLTMNRHFSYLERSAVALSSTFSSCFQSHAVKPWKRWMSFLMSLFGHLNRKAVATNSNGTYKPPPRC